MLFYRNGKIKSFAKRRRKLSVNSECGSSSPSPSISPSPSEDEGKDDQHMEGNDDCLSGDEREKQVQTFAH